MSGMMTAWQVWEVSFSTGVPVVSEVGGVAYEDKAEAQKCVDGFQQLFWRYIFLRQITVQKAG
jgi:hypothetical protein